MHACMHACNPQPPFESSEKLNSICSCHTLMVESLSWALLWQSNAISLDLLPFPLIHSFIHSLFSIRAFLRETEFLSLPPMDSSRSSFSLGRTSFILPKKTISRQPAGSSQLGQETLVYCQNYLQWIPLLIQASHSHPHLRIN